MSSRLRQLSGSRLVRLLGSLTGLAIGVVALLPAFVSDGRVFPDRATGLLVLFLAPTLGWVFAPGATRPGIGNAALVSGGITLIAVPLGAFLVGAAMSIPTAAHPGDLVIAGFALGLIGIFLLGLPLALLTFVVANIWVFGLRAVLRLSARWTSKQASHVG